MAFMLGDAFSTLDIHKITWKPADGVTETKENNIHINGKGKTPSKILGSTEVQVVEVTMNL